MRVQYVCFIYSALTVRNGFVNGGDDTKRQPEPQVNNNGEYSDR